MSEPVITPRLRNTDGLLRGETGTKGRRGCAYFCLDVLGEFVDIPTAKYYWVEASTKQWQDGSGSRVTIKRKRDGWWYRNKSGVWDTFMWVVTPYLQRLHCKLNQPTTIYFCLWYEE